MPIYLNPEAFEDKAIPPIKNKENIINTTYSKLKSWVDNNKLIPGMQYRITDYVTTTTQANTKSAGHQFDIIVTANNNNTLNEEARAIQHEGNEYFSNSNLNAWKIWYTINNDTTKFAWADAENGKGVIYRMIDEWNNDVPYDFKNILFKVYYDEDLGTYKVGTKDNSEWSYTFCMLDKYDNKPHDVSVEQYKYINDENFYNHTYNNKILSYYNSYANTTEETINNGAYKLNTNVFVTDTNICSVEQDYYYGEFYAFVNNSLGNDCNNNSLGNDCYNNSLGNSCYNNSLGNSCYNNSFGNSCYSNSLGNSCYNNSFGNNCNNNSLGNSCNNNSFGNNCYNNSLGNDCYNNSLGNSCYNNSLGNSCYNNSFGNNCNNIKFALNKTAITKYNYYKNNHFGDGCSYILFKGTTTASDSQQIQNYNFSQGLQDTSNAYLEIDGVRNRAYETKVAKNSNGEIKQYCEADLIL